MAANQVSNAQPHVVQLGYWYAVLVAKPAYLALRKDTFLQEHQSAKYLGVRTETTEMTMTYLSSDPFTVARIFDLVRPELRNVVSKAELTKRLARFGYGYRDTPRGRILTTVPHGVEIAPMPSAYSSI
jgi:hypothetical protein